MFDINNDADKICVFLYPRAYLGISVKPMSDKNVGKTN